MRRKQKVRSREIMSADPIDHVRKQLEALLEVSEAIAHQRDLPALFHELAIRLHSVVDFDFLTLLLYDAAKNVIRLHVLEAREARQTPQDAQYAILSHPPRLVCQ